MKPFRSILLAFLLLVPPALAAVGERRHRFPNRFAVVIPGRLFRGGFPTAGDVRNLKSDRGIQTIISLTGDKNEPKYEDEKRTAESLSIRLLRFPMPGNGCADFGDLDRAADALADALANPGKRPVFYHCDAGKQRSNALLAAYRMRAGRWSFDRALQELVQSYDLDRENEKVLVDHLRAYAKWLEASGRGAE